MRKIWRIFKKKTTYSGVFDRDGCICSLTIFLPQIVRRQRRFDEDKFLKKRTGEVCNHKVLSQVEAFSDFVRQHRPIDVEVIWRKRRVIIVVLFEEDEADAFYEHVKMNKCFDWKRI